VVVLGEMSGSSGGIGEVRYAVSSTVGSIPPVTKAVLSCLVLTCVVCNLPFIGASIASVFALVPGYTFGKMYVWNVITFAFVETSLVALAVSCTAVIVLGRVLEPMWGSAEIATFLFVVCLSSGALTCSTSVIVFSITRAPYILFDPVNGFAPVIAAYGVAVKQLLPEYDIFSLGNTAITSRYLPLILCGMQFVLVVTDVLTVGYLFSMIYCVVSAYVYLRFIQFRDGVRGDSSDAFAFKMFFPEPLQSIIGAVLNTASAAFNKLRSAKSGGINTQHQKATAASASVEHRLSADSVVLDMSGGGGDVAGGGDGDQMDADRRKSRAMRALDERLKSGSNNADAPTNERTANNAAHQPET